MTQHYEDEDDNQIVADLLANAPTLDDSIASAVVIEVPQVPAEKEAKLALVLEKLSKKICDAVVYGTIRFPRDAGAELSKGFALIEYETPQMAHHVHNPAPRGLNGYSLDKKHKLRVYMLSEVNSLAELSDEYKAPEPRAYKERENLKEWLLNDKCQDEFVTLHQNITSIFLNTKEEPTLVHKADNWTENQLVLSPRGTYMATFHRQGIALWGGKSWSQIAKFLHPGVALIDFSPCENYLVTWSNMGGQGDKGDNSMHTHVWDIRKPSQPMRSFPQDPQNMRWPVLKWSHDDKYVARLSDKQDGISVYELPSMKLLDKKSFKIEEVKDFAWSPTDHILAYWQPEIGNNPARVTLVTVPDRREARTKNLFNVSACNLHWQKSGDHLCVKVDRHTKTKKSTFTNFELFRVREKQIPVDALEIKEPIVAFAWEPHGSKFAIITSDTATKVDFYKLDDIKKGGKLVLIKRLEQKLVNHIFWSPNGRFVVLAGIRNMSGALEFWDTEDMTLMTQTEHFMCTDVEWDPTGRYVSTSVSYWRHQMENGFFLWTFQGNNLLKRPVDKFNQFLWRPRPPTLLSADQQRQIKKNLKTYSTRFDKIDSMVDSSATKELIDARRELYNAFREFRDDVEARFREQQARRVELRGEDSEDEEDYIEREVVVEVTVSDVRKVVSK